MSIYDYRIRKLWGCTIHSGHGIIVVVRPDGTGKIRTTDDKHTSELQPATLQRVIKLYLMD